LSEWFLKPDPVEEKQVQINHHKYCTKSELRTQTNVIHLVIFLIGNKKQVADGHKGWEN
jgi:hypothetical protein